MTDAEARLIELSPKEAEAAIRANRLTQPTRISRRLDLTACSQFEEWPAEGTIHHGALILRNCIGIRSLPARPTVSRAIGATAWDMTWFGTVPYAEFML